VLNEALVFTRFSSPVLFFAIPPLPLTTQLTPPPHQTACLALFNGLNLPLPSPSTASPPTKSSKPSTSEYLVVLGGASSVGQMAIQLALATRLFTGVVASCSARSAALVRGLGAVPFDYKKGLAAQVTDVLELSAGGKFRRVFDAVAGDGSAAKALLAASTMSPPAGAEPGGERWKYFATTNDWSGIGGFDAATAMYEVKLGPIGRPTSTELNAHVARFLPVIAAWLADETVRPSPYDVVGKGGMADAIRAYEYQKRGAGGFNKVLAKIQEP
jgi:NADPH:quinone reductase-like Zn-dependent oxidoreductase